MLSDDIPVKQSEKVHLIKPEESIEVNDVKITALGSTDAGVAFLVMTDSVSIFHAGDLNWWHWEGEPDDYNKGMADGYKREINKLKDIHLDAAFIPVDKRLEDAMYYSIDYLMSTVDVDTVCPIHFCGDMKDMEKVKSDLADRDYFNKINFYEE